MKKTISFVLTVAIIISMVCLSAAYSGYQDVSNDSWYSDAVEFVTEKGLFNGTSSTQFSPDKTMTRAMFVTVLGRLAGINGDIIGYGVITKDAVNLRSSPNTSSNVLAVLSKDVDVPVLEQSADWYKVKYNEKTGYVRNDLITVSGSRQFTDISFGQYYNAYIQWAYDASIVSGTSSKTFSPNQGITREQLCTILNNYAKDADITLTATLDKANFTDDSTISSYAKDAVYTLQQTGIVTGRSNGAFDPAASATRAEVAVMLKRFVDLTNAVTPTADVTPTPDATPSSTPTQSPDPDDRPVYDETPYVGYALTGNVVSEKTAVNDTYFNDACFIGHSIVVGMENYFALPNADFYAVSGISASAMLKYSQFELATTDYDDEGKPVKRYGTIEDVLTEKAQKYGKIYIMLGTNELGPDSYHATTYYNNMRALVAMVKQTHPNTKIYLIATIPVSRDRSIHNTNYTRDNVLIFNNKLMQVSTIENVYYLDAFGLFADGKGYLPQSYCLNDGIHILKPQYAQFKTFLKTHTA